MYESFFHFSRRPFAAAPDPEAYFPASSVEQARLTLTRCIDRGTGPGLLIGPAGLGKTLVCELLARHFADRFSVATLANARLSTPRALLQSILFELGLPFRDMGEGELRLSLIDHAAPSKGGVNGMLLIVDEAHCLSPRLLEEIRMITNLVRDGQLRVRVVLSGGSRLEERLASTKLASFNQRIAARCYLEPLNYEETCRYVQAQLSAANAAPDSVFTEDALTAIHRCADGIPRLINQVADHALVLAAAGGQPCIDAAGINEAWSDLQQIPSLVSDDAQADRDQAASGVVEFGSLADDEDELVAVAAVGTATAGPVDLTQRLDHIERHVDEVQRHELPVEPRAAHVDEQFDPQASAIPEVELVFEEAEDPFAENFEEQEVIPVRAAPFRNELPQQDEARPGHRQAVVAADQDLAEEDFIEEDLIAAEPDAPADLLPERTASAAYEPPTDGAHQRESDLDDPAAADEPTVVEQPLADAPQRPQFAVVADSNTAAPGTGQDEEDPPAEMVGNDQRPRTEDLPSRNNDGGVPDFAAPELDYEVRYGESTVAMADGPFVAEQEATAVTVIPLSLWTDAVTDPLPADDRDIIVVDDRAAAQAASGARTARRRRNDYRRLFAQLREREA